MVIAKPSLPFRRFGERGFFGEVHWGGFSVRVKSGADCTADSLRGLAWIQIARGWYLSFAVIDPFELKEPEVLQCAVCGFGVRCSWDIVLPSRRGQYYFWEAREVRRGAAIRDAEEFVAQMFLTSVRSPGECEEKAQ